MQSKSAEAFNFVFESMWDLGLRGMVFSLDIDYRQYMAVMNTFWAPGF